MGGLSPLVRGTVDEAQLGSKLICLLRTPTEMEGREGDRERESVKWREEKGIEREGDRERESVKWREEKGIERERVKWREEKGIERERRG